MSGYVGPTVGDLTRLPLYVPSCPRCGDLMYRHIPMPTANGKALACPTSFAGQTTARREAPAVTEVPAP